MPEPRVWFLMTALFTAACGEPASGAGTAGDLAADAPDGATAADEVASAADTPSEDATPEVPTADIAAAPDVALADDAESADLGEEPDGVTPSLPPTEPGALVAWLEAREYEGWPAEAAPHDSTGPHFGTVRTFLRGTLATSLEGEGGGGHPVGSAAVKELYGKGETVLGWSVMVKTESNGGGNAWYWFERYNGSQYASSQGAGLCTACHSAGDDFVLTPWPQ